MGRDMEQGVGRDWERSGRRWKGHGEGTGKGLGANNGMGQGADNGKGAGAHSCTLTCTHGHVCVCVYMFMYIYICIYTHVLIEPSRALLGRGPFKDPPPHFPPSPRQPIRAHHPQPIKARLPSGPLANQRLPLSTRRLRAPRPGRELFRAPEASGAAAPPGPTREPTTAAPRPGDEPPLPCRSRRTQCQPSWSHMELCACARCGGAVAGARGIVGAVVQVERSAGQCGSCSAEAG